MKSVRATALGINRKNLYRSLRLPEKDLQLKQQIEEVHRRHPAYGHRRVSLSLQVNRKRVRRVMHQFDLKPPRRCVRFSCTQAVPHHQYPNLLKGYTVTRPHEVWCSDVSGFKFQGKFWYLATVIDIYTRQVVGVQVGKHHESQLVLGALKEALATTQMVPSYFHSDQGAEFLAQICVDFLEAQGIQVSVSDKASPWQNGYQESFFGRLKEEFGDIRRFERSGALIEALYQQVHYYNHERIHTALKMPPARFAQQILRHLSS